MKKITLTALALMAFAFTQAQDVKFGAKAGVNLANLTGDVEDNSMKVGFHVGGFAEIKFSDKLALQPELLYSTQGYKYDYSVGDESEDTKLNLSYINVPVMFKFYPVEKLFIEAGPQIGFLMSAKAKSEGTYLEFDEETFDLVSVRYDEENDVKDGFKSIDFGFNIGAGFEFTENLFAGARYNIGLANIADVDSSDDYDIKNSVISISVGYKF